jgi:hypothetical protein
MASPSLSNQHEDINFWINLWAAKVGHPLRPVVHSRPPSSYSECIEDFYIASIKFLYFNDKRRLKGVNEALELYSQAWKLQEQDYQRKQRRLNDSQAKTNSLLEVYALRLSRDLAYIVGVAPINSTLCYTFHHSPLLKHFLTLLMGATFACLEQGDTREDSILNDSLRISSAATIGGETTVSSMVLQNGMEWEYDGIADVSMPPAIYSTYFSSETSTPGGLFRCP